MVAVDCRATYCGDRKDSMCIVSKDTGCSFQDCQTEAAKKGSYAFNYGQYIWKGEPYQTWCRFCDKNEVANAKTSKNPSTSSGMGIYVKGGTKKHSGIVI